jgi:DNA-directed RNA polymerase subunit RPC12/RpoP
MHRHSRVRPFACPHCHKTFEDQLRLEAHARVHAAPQKPYSCGYCHKSFGNVNALRQHGRRVHECEDCGATLAGVEERARHRAEQHPTTAGQHEQAEPKRFQVGRGDGGAIR